MQQTNHQVSQTIIYILAWFICAVIVIADVLVVRQASLDVMTAVQVQVIENSENKGAARLNSGCITEFIDRAIIIAGAMVAVAFSIYIEYYFRKGKEQGNLLKRIGRTLAILIGVLLVAVIILTFV